jgi:hypothetical protein
VYNVSKTKSLHSLVVALNFYLENEQCVSRRYEDRYDGRLKDSILNNSNNAEILFDFFGVQMYSYASPLVVLMACHDGALEVLDKLVDDRMLQMQYIPPAKFQVRYNCVKFLFDIIFDQRPPEAPEVIFAKVKEAVIMNLEEEAKRPPASAWKALEKKRLLGIANKVTKMQNLQDILDLLHFYIENEQITDWHYKDRYDDKVKQTCLNILNERSYTPFRFSGVEINHFQKPIIVLIVCRDSVQQAINMFPGLAKQELVSLESGSSLRSMF